MRGLPSRSPPSALFSTLLPAADPRPGAASAPRHSLRQSPRNRRGLLSGILESVGGLLGFGNNQAHPSDPKDTGSGGPSTPGKPDSTSVKPPVDQPSPPAQAPPASYPAPGGGGQVDKPTWTALMPPASVSSVSSGSAHNQAAPGPSSTSPPDAMNVAPTLSSAPLAHESQHVSDIHVGTATSHTAAPGLPSVFSSISSAPSPTGPPTTAAHEKRFPLPAAASIGAVLGFLVVSALFWAVWLALGRRLRTARAYPEFASVHPKRMLSVVSVPETDENPFTHPRDEKEDNPFDAAALWEASSARSMASTLSV